MVAAPTKVPPPQHGFLRVLGLEEANDVNLHLQPLQGLLEDMEQMEYTEVTDAWQNHQAQPAGLIWAAAEPQRLWGDTSPH